MSRIKPGFILPSAAYTVPRNQIRRYGPFDRAPRVGDLVYGRVKYLGQHTSLENREGRLHHIQDGTRAIFVFGNRYAPDYYEGLVPETVGQNAHMLARSGIIGTVICKSARVGDPTRVEVLGAVLDRDGQPLNTRNFNRILPKQTEKTGNRARMILVVGTSMNSGKSAAAAACCWGLSTMGHTVRGSKITGTASLKDILLMEDNGATPVTDFTSLGFPSTYMLSEEELLGIFDTLDLKYANSPRNYWVVEIADGLMQRETAMLLGSQRVTERIHRLVFTAYDAFGAIGGLRILRDEFDLTPHALSGVVSSSPLGIRELQKHTDLPIFNSIDRDLQTLAAILV